MLHRLILIATLTVTAHASDFAPNADIQQQLRAETGLDRLLTQTQPEELFAQLLHHAAHAGNQRAAMYAATTQRRLPLGREARIEIAVDLLETQDARLQRTVRNVLAGYEGRTPTRASDLTIYLPLLSERIRQQQEIAESFRTHLFDADPHAAVVVLMRAHQLRDPQRIQQIRWSAHLGQAFQWRKENGFADRTADLRTELASLQQQLNAAPEWWLKRYAATVQQMLQ